MKKLLNSLCLVWLVCSLTACNSVGLRSLATVGESVNGAMNVYGEMYRADVLSQQEINDVRTKHAAFQLVYNQAIEFVKNDTSKPAPSEVADLAFSLVIFVNQLKSRHP